MHESSSDIWPAFAPPGSASVIQVMSHSPRRARAGLAAASSPYELSMLNAGPMLPVFWLLLLLLGSNCCRHAQPSAICLLQACCVNLMSSVLELHYLSICAPPPTHTPTPLDQPGPLAGTTVTTAHKLRSLSTQSQQTISACTAASKQHLTQLQILHKGPKPHQQPSLQGSSHTRLPSLPTWQ